MMTQAKDQPNQWHQQKNYQRWLQDGVIDQKAEADRRKDRQQGRKSEAAQRCEQRAANADFVQVTFPESVWPYILLFSSYLLYLLRFCRVPLRRRRAAILHEAGMDGYRRTRTALIGDDSLHTLCDCSEATWPLRAFGLAPTRNLHACLNVLEHRDFSRAPELLLNLLNSVVKAVADVTRRGVLLNPDTNGEVASQKRRDSLAAKVNRITPWIGAEAVNAPIKSWKRFWIEQRLERNGFDRFSFFTAQRTDRDFRNSRLCGWQRSQRIRWATVWHRAQGVDDGWFVGRFLSSFPNQM
jgi:hypothetical protein